MSMLKHVDAQSGHLVDDQPTAPARADILKALDAQLQRIEDANAVALKAAAERAAQAEAALATLQKEHDELVARHAESTRKLDVLHELKLKLDGL